MWADIAKFSWRYENSTDVSCHVILLNATSVSH